MTSGRPTASNCASCLIPPPGAPPDAPASTPATPIPNPALARQIWQAICDLGVDGGQVLEPGTGTGVFIGLAPPPRATAAELDRPPPGSAPSASIPSGDRRRIPRAPPSCATVPLTRGRRQRAVADVRRRGGRRETAIRQLSDSPRTPDLRYLLRRHGRVPDPGAPSMEWAAAAAIKSGTSTSHSSASPAKPPQKVPWRCAIAGGTRNIRMHPTTPDGQLTLSRTRSARLPAAASRRKPPASSTLCPRLAGRILPRAGRSHLAHWIVKGDRSARNGRWLWHPAGSIRTAL